MHILITGGTGFIGSRLVQYLLENNHSCTIVSRSPRSANAKGIEYCTWEDSSLLSALKKSNGVVNLAGESLASLWTDAKLKRFYSSRVDSGKRLTRLIIENNIDLSCFVQGSAIGYYGSRGDEILSERSKKGDGFLADLCAAWEGSSAALEGHGIRRVILRTGLVLDESGGLLKTLRLPFKLFLGGHLGDGKHFMSNISRDELCEMLLNVLLNEKFSGILNGVDGKPVLARDFFKAFGKSLGRPSWAHIPAFLLKMLPNNMADEFLLGSQRIMKD